MKITETDLINFIQNEIILPKDKATVYGKQVESLRKRLEKYINDNPEFQLIKMLNSGSIAKGTSLSTINDIDVALYIKPDDIENYELKQVLEYVREALVKVYDGLMEAEQFTLGTHCIKVSFQGSGLDVDVVPVIYRGKENDRGDLLNRDTGEWVETSIPLHLEFIRARKDLYSFYSDLVRITKWWRNERDFKFKSFLIELIWCHLVDTQNLPDSRIDAFAKFLFYILRTKMNEQIIFTDYYEPLEVQDDLQSPVKIYDPVNPKNNAAKNLTDQEREKIIEEAQTAFDVLSMASSAYTKEKAVENWQKILGSSFNP